MTEENLLNNKLLNSKTERILAAAGLSVFAVGCFVVGFFNPVSAGFFPACPMLSITGFACPGCGLTRGFHALFHGDIMTAISYNALIPFYVIIFLYSVSYLILIVIRGRGLNFRLVTPVTLTVFLVISVIFGVLRNIPAYPFTFFFP